MTYRHIETDFKDGLGTITLNNPPLNILNIAMMKEINNMLESWQGKKDLKVVLFRARGKCFSVGGDVREHMEDRVPEWIKTFQALFRNRDKRGFQPPPSVMVSVWGGGLE